MLYEFSLKALLNNYHHLCIKAPMHTIDAKPGHYIVIDEKYPCYIMGQAQGLEMIANPALSHYLSEKKQIKISSLQGLTQPAPDDSKIYLLLGENEAINAVIFYLKHYRKVFNGLVLLQSDDTFPFAPCPSRLLTPMLPSEVIAALPLLEDWGIVSRLASPKEAPGVYQGSLEALAEHWLSKVHSSVEKIQFTSLVQPLAPYCDPHFEVVEG